jgi:hypothetical protein
MLRGTIPIYTALYTDVPLSDRLKPRTPEGRSHRLYWLLIGVQAPRLAQRARHLA